MTGKNSQEKYPWAGPVLFTTVAIIIGLLFWWFV
jgi:hypothetical protein